MAKRDKDLDVKLEESEEFRGEPDVPSPAEFELGADVTDAARGSEGQPERVVHTYLCGHTFSFGGTEADRESWDILCPECRGLPQSSDRVKVYGA